MASEPAPAEGRSQAPKDEPLIETVCTAVALGWQMAELYHERAAPAAVAPALPPSVGAAPIDELPGVGGLSFSDAQRLHAEQVVRGLSKLAGASNDPRLAALATEDAAHSGPARPQGP